MPSFMKIRQAVQLMLGYRQRRAWWSPLKAFILLRKERLTVRTPEAG